MKYRIEFYRDVNYGGEKWAWDGDTAKTLEIPNVGRGANDAFSSFRLTAPTAREGTFFPEAAMVSLFVDDRFGGEQVDLTPDASGGVAWIGDQANDRTTSFKVTYNERAAARLMNQRKIDKAVADAEARKAEFEAAADLRRVEAEIAALNAPPGTVIPGVEGIGGGMLPPGPEGYGQGVPGATVEPQAIEFSVLASGDGFWVARTPQTSAGGGDANPHRGVSVINPGSWQKVTGGAQPRDVLSLDEYRNRGWSGLDRRFLAWQGSGSVQPAGEELSSAMDAAEAGDKGAYRALRSVGVEFKGEPQAKGGIIGTLESLL